MNRLAQVALAAIFVLVSSATFADNLAGSDRFVCSASTLTACTEDGDCFKGAPIDFNVPQFVEVDLQKKRLSTTKASGQNRVTDILNLLRKDGFILLQGEQNSRAFSWMINEALGLATISVATDGFSIAVFGSCTPMSDTK